MFYSDGNQWNKIHIKKEWNPVCLVGEKFPLLDLDGQEGSREDREVGLAGRRRGNSPCLRPQCIEGGEDGASLWEVVARLIAEES